MHKGLMGTHLKQGSYWPGQAYCTCTSKPLCCHL